MKKEAKVEFGIVITKPWSSEMYAHNEQVADLVRNEVEARWIAALMKFQEELGEEFMSDTEWAVLATAEMKEIQRAITCYGFGYGYDVADVAERVMQELDDAPLFRLKEIAEDLEIELEKGFVGFS
jgi:hypothetical protein